MEKLAEKISGKGGTPNPPLRTISVTQVFEVV